MLDWEFYCVNATTMLLWLFQRIDHGVLISLVVLGALCVLVSTCVLASRLVSYMLSTLFFLLNIIFFNIPFSMLRRTLLRGAVANASAVRTSSRIELPATSEILERLMLGAARPAVASLMGTQRPLSLPQHLALNSNQWTELEASRSVDATPQDVIPCRPVALNAVEDDPPTSPQIYVRRSARIRRARVRTCRAGTCST